MKKHDKKHNKEKGGGGGSSVSGVGVSVITFSPVDNRCSTSGNPALSIQSMNNDIVGGMAFFVVSITSRKNGGIEIKMVNDMNEAYIIRTN